MRPFPLSHRYNRPTVRRSFARRANHGRSAHVRFPDLADTLLAHAPALTLAIGTVVAMGLIVVIVMLACGRASHSTTPSLSSGWPISMRVF